MSRWGYWEWIAYATFFIGACVIAADTGFRISPDLMEHLPNFFRSGWWGFAPLALVLLATAILVAKAFGWLPKAKPSEPTAHSSNDVFPIWPEPYRPIQVFSRTFQNERVLLDGHSYHGCRFINVTFVYNGTTAFQLGNLAFEGSMGLASDNPAVSATILLLKGLNVLNERFRVDIPPNNIITPVSAPTSAPPNKGKKNRAPE